ncbi:MAG: glycoside hydrolase family 172 protein [Acidobacteriaceae bacterium]
MREALIATMMAVYTAGAWGQAAPWMPDVTQQQTYTWRHASSAEPMGGNRDAMAVTPGQTMTVLDTDGPGEISHIWFTIDSPEPYHLKRMVLRMYWDGEETPSVETPIGDFFGLGLGVYYNWQSELLSVGNTKALNCFFPMPYQKHARITVTNEGKMTVQNLYYNIDYRTDAHPLPPGTLYFHAQYRQAQPNHGWTNQWYENGDPLVNYRRNTDAKDNYVWFEAKGHGQFVGVTMSVLQNQDGWWGEGDPMFFIDNAETPMLPGGTGSEDYFLGAWDFGGWPFAYSLYGAPMVGKELAGERWSLYRFHLDSPIPFTKSMKATIEHGHANHRSDNFYSVAYWYQAEPHMPFPPLPSMDDRIPTLQIVGGPGNGEAGKPATGLSPK